MLNNICHCIVAVSANVSVSRVRPEKIRSISFWFVHEALNEV